jgi:hypothetical protein
MGYLQESALTNLFVQKIGWRFIAQKDFLLFDFCGARISKDR